MEMEEVGEEKYHGKVKELTVLRERQREAMREIQDLRRKRDSMLDVLLYIRSAKDSTVEDVVNEGVANEVFPVVLGKAHSKFSVTSIGFLPAEEHEEFFNELFIYPPGFRSKRKYFGSRGSGKEGVKVVYYCSIKEVEGRCVFEVRCTGKVWEGEREAVWKEFRESFDKMSYGSIEEFFGLSHETVQRMVEEMGDCTVYGKYVASSLRPKKRKGGRRSVSGMHAPV